MFSKEVVLADSSGYFYSHSTKLSPYHRRSGFCVACRYTSYAKGSQKGVKRGIESRECAVLKLVIIARETFQNREKVAND